MSGPFEKIGSAALRQIAQIQRTARGVAAKLRTAAPVRKIKQALAAATRKILAAARAEMKAAAAVAQREAVEEVFAAAAADARRRPPPRRVSAGQKRGEAELARKAAQRTAAAKRVADEKAQARAEAAERAERVEGHRRRAADYAKRAVAIRARPPPPPLPAEADELLADDAQPDAYEAPHHDGADILFMSRVADQYAVGVGAGREARYLSKADAEAVVALMEPGRDYALTARIKSQDVNGGFYIEHHAQPLEVDGVAVVNDNLKTESLIYRDSVLYGVDYAEAMGGTAVWSIFYTLRALRAGDLARYAPMRDGGKNCLIECARTLFTDGGDGTNGARKTARALGLTKERADILNDFEAGFLAKGGCDYVNDIPRLEMSKPLALRIDVYNVDGSPIYETKRSKIGKNYLRVIAHNGHACFVPPRMPSRFTTISRYQAERKREERKTRQHCAEDVEPELLAMAAKESATRVFFMGPAAYATSAGKLVLPHAVHEKVMACVDRDFGTTFHDEQGPSEDPRVAAAFAVRAARAAAAAAPADKEAEKRANEAHAAFKLHWDRADEYLDALDRAERCVSSRQWLFGCFERINGLARTKKANADKHKAACMELRPWQCAEYEPRTTQIDQCASFPSVFSEGSAARPYLQEFGFVVTDNSALYSIGGPVTKEHPILQGVAGSAEVVAWKFDEKKARDCVIAMLTPHLAAKRWTPLPVLAYLMREGLLVELSLREVMISLDARREVTFPKAARGDKAVCRELLGSLTKNGRRTTGLFRDPEEAADIVRHTAATGRFCTQRDTKFGAVITFNEKEERATYHHARASFLGYVWIALIMKIQSLPPRSVCRVVTDALWVRTDALPHHPDATECTEWGAWRVKGVPTYKRAPAEHWTAAPAGAVELEASKAPDFGDDGGPAEGADLRRWLRTQRLVYLFGQGGSGKTFAAIKAFFGRSLVVLCPTNDLAQAHRNNKEFKGIHTSTFHKFFKLGTSKIEDWSEARLGRKRLPSVIVWDEIDFTPLRIVRPMLDFLRRRGTTVVLCGDPGQIGAFDEAEQGSVHPFLLSQKDITSKRVDDDRRAKTPELRAIKARMWLKPIGEQLEQMRKSFPRKTWPQFLREWQPSHCVLCPTNALGAQVEKAIQGQQCLKHREAPHLIRYDPANGRAQNIDLTPPGCADKVKVCRGTIVAAPRYQATLPPEWKSAQWSTINRAQGRTIEAPTVVWIFDHHLSGWAENLPYTAVSRAQSHTQIRIVTLEAHEQPLRPLCADEKENRIRAKLALYRRSDAGKKRAGGEAIELADVLALEKCQNGRCKRCARVVAWGGYQKGDRRQFSIDRIDNALGHVRGNVRLFCLGCNRIHGAADDTAERADAAPRAAPPPYVATAAPAALEWDG